LLRHAGPAPAEPANSRAFAGPQAYNAPRGIPPPREHAMAKGQKRSNREVRKPKAEKGKKHNASQPTLKPGGIGTVETIKNR
jgi:hypothetical protein